MKHLTAALLIIFLLLSCGEGDQMVSDNDASNDSDTSGNNGAITLDGECPADKKLSTGFKASMGTEYSVVEGKVTNGVIPSTVTEVSSSAGDCKLLLKKNPHCDPACDPTTEVCSLDEECVDMPRNQDLGTVTITGMKKKISMEPRGSGKNYFDSDSLPYPLFDEGDEIRLKTTGGEYKEINLEGYGVTRLESDDSLWLINKEKDLTITWHKPQKELSEVVLRLKIDQHGTSPLELKCVFEDTGEGVVPASLIDTMLNSGISGYPNGKIIRRTVDSMDISDGCVEFQVTSEKPVDVRVSGSTPCKNNDDCPDGQTCNKAKEICE